MRVCSLFIFDHFLCILENEKFDDVLNANDNNTIIDHIINYYLNGCRVTYSKCSKAKYKN